MAKESFGQLLGKLIRERRETAAMTQRELAWESFPHEFGHEGKERRIRELELGRVSRPQARTYMPICETLNIDREMIAELKRQVADGPSRSERTPPSVPAQTRGAHFTIRDGLVATVPTQDIGLDENNYRRLAALQSPLLNASKNSHAELSKNNKPFAALLDVTDNYLSELDKDVHEINYAVLYAYGLQLAVAFESTEKLIKKGRTARLRS